MQRFVPFALALVSILALDAGCKHDAGPSSGPEFSSRQGLGTTSADEAAPSGTTWEGRAKSSRAPAGGAYGADGAPAPVPTEAWRDDAEFEADSIAREESRPGLGTSYGEHRRSSVESVEFRRAEPNTPDVVFSIRYDDVDGVRAAAKTKRSRAFSDDAIQHHSGLSFALLDSGGRILPAAALGAELWAIGEPDARYSLAIANDTNSAFEVVASVDGLDVVDGRPADFASRGYIVDPFSSVVIEGWRTSEDAVAAFRFSSIEDSYAERMGEGRNVGVIGAAFFREAPRAWEEWRAPEETWRRDRADPFPGR